MAGQQSFDLPTVIDNSHGQAAAGEAGAAATAAAAKAGAYNKLYEGTYGAAIGGAQALGPYQDSDGKVVGQSGSPSQAQDSFHLHDHLGKNADDSANDGLTGYLRKKIEDGFFKHEPTKEEVADAEKQFDSHISGLISDSDRKLLSTMAHAVLEGDPKALADALAQLKDDPAKLKAFVKEMDRMFQDMGVDASMALTGDGHVLLYNKSGSAALEIDPAKGIVGERPISVRPDGTVVLEPGQILNGDPERLAKTIGNTAVGSIENPYITFDPIWNPYEHKHLPIRPSDPGFNPDPTWKRSQGPDEQPWWKKLGGGNKHDPFSSDNPTFE